MSSPSHLAALFFDVETSIFELCCLCDVYGVRYTEYGEFQDVIERVEDLNTDRSPPL